MSATRATVDLDDAEGLIAAVGSVGAVLGQHVPPVPGDVDELSNKVILL